MAKAAADDTFTSSERAGLGLPEVLADVGHDGSNTGGVETRAIGGNPHEPFVEGGRNDLSNGDPGAGASGHGASSAEVTAHERLLSSSGEAAAAVAETGVGGDDSQSGLNGDAERPGVEETRSATENSASAGSSDRSAGGSAYGGGAPRGARENILEQEGSAANELDAREGSVAHRERAASVPAQSRGDSREGEALDSGPEGSAAAENNMLHGLAKTSPGPVDQRDQ